MANLTAAKRLDEWVKSNGGVRSPIARMLGISPPTFSEWCDGKGRPRDYHRDLLAELTGIEPDAWRTKKERTKAERGRARIQAFKSAA